MAFSAGVYTLPGAALNTGDTVSATENNTLRNDMATAFNKTWLRDGTATATANIPMGTYKLTGLGNGTASGDSIAYGQTADVVLNGLTVGKGAGAAADATVLGNGALGSNASGTTNTAIGYAVFGQLTTSNSNTGVGAYAGRYSTGAVNTAVGQQALQGTSGSATGSNNAAFGFQTLYTNSSGSNNVAVGNQSLFSNTTASNNTAVGYQAAYSNTTGGITAFGFQSGYKNSTGVYNAVFGGLDGGGVATLYNNTTGSGNSAFGAGALQGNSTGSNNTTVGYQALAQNTTASNNTAVGYQAGLNNNTGTGNSFFGVSSGATVTGNYNTAIGRFALGDTGAKSGDFNTAFGNAAGALLTSGTNNTFIGPSAGYSISTGSKNTILGAFNGNQSGLDIRTASNWGVLSDGDGNPFFAVNNAATNTTAYISAPTGIRYSQLGFCINSSIKSEIYWDNTNTNLYVVNASGGVYLTNTGTSWTSNSDERLKENLTPIENGLSKVCALRSVIGNFIADETKKPTPFLIAQDVQAVLPEAVTTSTLKGDDTNTEYLGVAYTEVIPLLVAAIKELKADLDATKAELTAKDERIQILENYNSRHEDSIETLKVAVEALQALKA